MIGPWEGRKMAQQKLCISGDSHVVEPREVFAGLVERFGENAPHIVKHPEGGDVLKIKVEGKFARSEGPIEKIR